MPNGKFFRVWRVTCIATRDQKGRNMSKLEGLEKLSSYEILERRDIPDVGSTSVLLRHKKSGARVALLSNDDENKVFYIGFRTPPRDSTGVPHILEHSVLCGSREFPVKDPFVELVKGSLNTFLNAMTYPDKTVYPVASCNDKDFRNLVHVYLDAVFYPNIYQKEAIFRQEGWHYEIGEDGALSINGVVYNEMKGVYSSAEDVLATAVMNSLYPHTTYGVESGGDPDVIPELTYEKFLEFHRTYYHPSNSYLYLYGDMDMAEQLDFIDREYLSAFGPLTVDSEITREPDGFAGAPVVRDYPLNEGESAEDNTYLTINWSVGESTDTELCTAFQVLDYVLCSAPGAPLKQTLVDRGLGKDIYSIWESGIRQPYFSVVAKGVAADRREEFLQTVKEVLTGIAEKGFDEKALLAALNYYEFKYREADFGSYPRGLMLGLQMLDGWLYDDAKPFAAIELLNTFRVLRERVGSGWYEELVRKYLLENPHRVSVTLNPVEGLQEKHEEELRKKLAERKAAMSDAELDQVRAICEALRAFRETDDRPEDLARIPLLQRADLKKEAAAPVYEERELGGVPALYHGLETNGIGYLRLLFRLDDIPEEYFAYVGLFTDVLGLLNTEHYSYGDLFNEINLVTGGMSAVNNTYTQADDADRCTATLELKTKAFGSQLAQALELMQEIMLTSDFTDEKRLREILAESKSRMQAQMMTAGHHVAAMRALSYGSVSGVYGETLSGVALYRLNARLEEHFDEEKKGFIDKLQTLARMIFRQENLMVDFTGSEEAFASLAAPAEKLCGALYTAPVKKEHWVPVPERKNEGFLTAGQIQYVCRAGNFLRKGYAYTGALRVLKVLMGYEYLWVNIRVKGGAYGCMCSFGRSGESYFVSYRDPNLKKTVEVYEAAGKAISEFTADERTMTQYIIGAVSELDMPMNPAAKGMYGLSAYMTGLTAERIQRERDEVLNAQPEDIRRLGATIDAFMADDFFCAVGNAAHIKADGEMFEKTENLF